MSFVATGFGLTRAGGWRSSEARSGPLSLSGLHGVGGPVLRHRWQQARPPAPYMGWGNSPYGQMTADLSGIAAIAAGGNFTSLSRPMARSLLG